MTHTSMLKQQRKLNATAGIQKTSHEEKILTLAGSLKSNIALSDRQLKNARAIAWDRKEVRR